MICASLLSMTIGTGYWITVQNHTGYRSLRCIFMFTICLYIAMTGRTTGKIMQTCYLGPGADRCMTVNAATTACYLVNTAVITYRMVRARSMGMAVKVVYIMTIGTGRI